MCGLSAGIFWATEGGVAIAYPEPERRGRSISIWLILNQFGSIIGGSINLALNVKTDGAGGVGVNTYAVFVSLQCLGPFVAYLLSSPDKVQRRDGQPVKISSNNSFLDEVKATLKVWARPHTLILTLVFIQCSWGGAVTGTYVSTSFRSSHVPHNPAHHTDYPHSAPCAQLTNYFSVRARSLSSLVITLICWLIFYPFGRFLDWQRYSIRARATTSAAVLFVWLAVGWIWWFTNLVQFSRQEPAPVFDWTTPGWGNAWFSYVMYSLPQQLLYNWLFWVVSFLSAPGEGEDHVRYVGIMRSAESLSQCLSFAVSATAVPQIRASAVNLALFAVSIPAVTHTVWYISKRDKAGILAQTVHGEQASPKTLVGSESPDQRSLKDEKSE